MGRLEKFAIFIFAMCVAINTFVWGGWHPDTETPILQFALYEALIVYVPLRLLTWVFR